MSSIFQYAYASGSEPRELVNVCLNQLGEIPTQANLGFIYVSDALGKELDAILRLLKQSTNIKDWVGSLGIALCVTDKEIYDTPALAIMVTDLSLDSYRLVHSLEQETTPFKTENQEWIDQKTPLSGVIHGDPSNPLTPTLIESLASELGSGFFTGGLTSSQSGMFQVAGNVVTGGVSGVVFSSEVSILVGHTQGCSPLGEKHQVTKSHHNILHSLDQQPALQVLKQDIGEVLSRDLARLGGYIFVGLPIKGSDTSDYLVRNLIGIDEDRDIIAIGEVIEEGDQIMFCRRDGNSATEDMLRMLDKLKKQIGDRPIKGGLYHSCLGRGRYQFGDNSEELSLISQELGAFPLIGFFANGEIFHNRLYGYTGVLTLFL